MSNTTTIGALDALRTELAALRERLAAVEGTPAVKAHAHDLDRQRRVADALAIGRMPADEALVRLGALTVAARTFVFSIIGDAAIPLVVDHPEWDDSLPPSPAIRDRVWVARNVVPTAYRLRARDGLVWTRSRFPITADTAARLTALGCGVGYDGRNYSYTPRSWSTGDQDFATNEKLSTLRAIDSDFDRAISDGRIILTECSATESAAALLERR